MLPDGSSETLQNSYNALLAPLLLNSALTAVRAQPQSSGNANIAITNTTRALDKLELNTADKGYFDAFLSFNQHLNICSLVTAKALYRRALARRILKEEDGAEKDLVEASHLVPDDKAIAGELAKVKQHRKEQREKEKKAFKKLFS